MPNRNLKKHYKILTRLRALVWLLLLVNSCKAEGPGTDSDIKTTNTRAAGYQNFQFARFIAPLSVDDRVCSATWLDNSTLLTAAHCVYNKESTKFRKVQIVIPTVTLEGITISYEASRKIEPILSCYLAAYTTAPLSMEEDIAIIRVAPTNTAKYEKQVWGDSGRPLDLPYPSVLSLTDEQFKNNLEIPKWNFGGFGDIEQGDRRSFRDLNLAMQKLNRVGKKQISIIGDEHKKNAERPSLRHGDSGSPLGFFNPIDRTFYIVGVAAFISDTGHQKDEIATIFARITEDKRDVINQARDTAGLKKLAEQGNLICHK